MWGQMALNWAIGWHVGRGSNETQVPTLSLGGEWAEWGLDPGAGEAAGKHKGTGPVQEPRSSERERQAGGQYRVWSQGKTGMRPVIGQLWATGAWAGSQTWQSLAMIPVRTGGLTTAGRPGQE